MELSQHIQIIQKNKWLILIFTLLVGIASLIFAYQKPETYQASVSFDVNLINRGATPDYQYGSYYDLKGAEMYSQNAMSWLKTPAVIADIYTDAGLSYEIKNISKFTNRFKTRQAAAQNFIVTFDDVSAANAEKIANSLSKVVMAKATEGNTDINNNPLFKIVAAKPIIIKNEMNILLVTILGSIVGLVFSILFVYLKHYLQSAK